MKTRNYMKPITIINRRISLRAIQAKLGQNLTEYYDIFGRDRKLVINFDKLAIKSNIKC